MNPEQQGGPPHASGPEGSTTNFSTTIGLNGRPHNGRCFEWQQGPCSSRSLRSWVLAYVTFHFCPGFLLTHKGGKRSHGGVTGGCGGRQPGLWGCNKAVCVCCESYQPFLTSSSLPCVFFPTFFLFFFSPHNSSSVCCVAAGLSCRL